ncbi:hypothetical protein [Streptomyces sp. NPDC059256]|uniref:hypothetical protein n=1 Tax=Streptomyces sp. NPDC059256 TaxID=3346794 RepID=UPI0036CA9D3D
MADERYEWLDEEAAERLLRGEPVDVPDEPARTQAARLTAALRNARQPEVPAGVDDAELAGEAAALIAFRRARDRNAAGQEHDFGIVRVLPAPRPSLAARLMQPVRYGVIAALAGFAFGGVAVGATTGLLPSPFDEGSTPATSVSGAPTGEPPGEEPPWARGGQPTPRATEGGAAPPRVRPHEERTTTEPPVPGATTEPAEPPPGTPGVTVTEEPPAKNGKQRKLEAACRDHRAGTIDRKRLKRLEKAAQRHGVTVDQFCADVLGGASGSGQNGSHGQNGQGSQSSQNGGSGQSNQGAPGGQGIQGGPNSSGSNSSGSVTGAGSTAVDRPYGRPDKSHQRDTSKVNGKPKQRASGSQNGRGIRAAGPGPESADPVVRIYRPQR